MANQGFTAADMADQAAAAFERGRDSVLADRAAAAQEAVAWINPDDLSEFERAVVCLNSVRNLSGNDRYTMPLYAASVAAALGIDLSEVPRYTLAHGNFESQMLEHSRGAWVRLSDVESALISVSPKVATFHNDGNSEAQFIADEARLNCPACGGSGHVEDSPKGGIEAQDAARYRYHRDSGLTFVERNDYCAYRVTKTGDAADTATDAAMQANSHGAGASDAR